MTDSQALPQARPPPDSQRVSPAGSQGRLRDGAEGVSGVGGDQRLVCFANRLTGRLKESYAQFESHPL